jgi:hypothetical protein
LGDVLSGGCFCVRFTHLHKFSRIYTNFSHFPAKFVYLCICVFVFVYFCVFGYAPFCGLPEGVANMSNERGEGGGKKLQR